MGFSLKKFGKSLLKGAVKIGRTALVSAVKTTPIGAAAIKAAQALKAAGVSTKAARLKVQPLSVRASIEKARVPAPGREGPMAPVGMVARRAPRRRTLTTSDLGPSGDARVRRAMKKAAKKKTGRKAPAGGLDLKAISALWKSQGKPGTWIGFIKANPIRKR